MNNDDRCKARYFDGFGVRTCGHPIRRDGMCGIHANAAERRKRKQAERQARLDAQLAATEATRAYIREIGLPVLLVQEKLVAVDVGALRDWIKAREESA